MKNKLQNAFTDDDSFKHTTKHKESSSITDYKKEVEFKPNTTSKKTTSNIIQNPNFDPQFLDFYSRFTQVPNYLNNIGDNLSYIFNVPMVI